jgi:hypothetical protein
MKIRVLQVLLTLSMTFAVVAALAQAAQGQVLSHLDTALALVRYHPQTERELVIARHEKQAVQ